MNKLSVLQKLHAIEGEKIIYDIHYCKAGVGIIFYYPDKDPGGGPWNHRKYHFVIDDSWRQALSVDGYYPTFEACIEAEYSKMMHEKESKSKEH